MTTNCCVTFVVLVATTVMFAIATDGIEWLGLYRYNHEDRYWNSSADCRFFEETTRSSNRLFNDVTKLSTTAVGGGGGSRPTTRKSQRSKSMLGRDQRQLCMQSLELMPALVQSARTTVEVCRQQFDDWRWNCSSILLAPKFTPDLTSGSREQAFVVALAAASLSHAVAKTCSSGSTSKCGCGGQAQSTHTDGARSGPMSAKALSPGAEQFQWGGCGDDVTYGNEFGQRFASARWSQRTPSLKSLNDLHNQRVGRKILAGSLITSCKCHGVSGSCALKTCWRALPKMGLVGGLIMDNYHDSAVEVTSRRTGSSSGSGRKQGLSLVVSRTSREITDNQLSFYTLSPDYCLADHSLGAHGTHGRECQKDNAGSGGCRSMCCGRRFTTETITVQYRCDCRYYWCCYVKCRNCTEQVEIHRCT